MKYTDIVWDFNGTIIDDVEAGILSVNKMLSDRGLPTIPDRERYKEIFCFPIVEYYRKCGFDFEKEPYEVLAPIWVEQYLIHSPNSPMQEGVREAIELFESLGLRQHILSASELNMLCSQLESFGIKDRFDTIYGLDNIHAHSKTELAKRWRSEHPNARVLFIGDTKHDYATAEVLGADCALICCGHQPRATLEECQNAMVYNSLPLLCDDIKSGYFTQK